MARHDRAVQQISEDSVRERTSRDWDQWFALLDGWEAAKRPHTEVARWLVEEHGVDRWWAQSITVAYERARGVRVARQTSDGYFATSASVTILVSIDRLYSAFADVELRRGWLPLADLKVRTATAPKSLRADWEGGTLIAVRFTSKTSAKSQVSLIHEKLPHAEAAVQMQEFWREKLAALKILLECVPGA